MRTIFALSMALCSSVACGCSPQGAPALLPSQQLHGASSSPRTGATHLYVANGSRNTVVVSDPGTGAVVRTISVGVKRPDALAFDAAGNLYVANAGDDGVVTVYARESGRPLRRISHGIASPNALAFDRSDSLYVSNGTTHTVTVYAGGGTKLSRTISRGLKTPGVLEFDSAGNLYVANGNDVQVYAPGRSHPLRTIAQGVNRAAALAFDAAGNLYVANDAGNSVTVYAPGTTSVLRTIVDEVQSPVALVLDASGNLYVANCASPASNVTIYAPGTSTLVGEIGAGFPNALAFDGRAVYTAQPSTGGPSKIRNGSVLVTNAGPGWKNLRQIYRHLYNPAQLAFGP